MSDSSSFETLKAAESGRRLVSKSGRHEVAAKVAIDADGNEILLLRRWVGSHPGPNATADWSEPSAWQHIALDDDLNIVAAGWGKRERDSFEMVKRALKAKDILIGGGEGSQTKHFDPEFEGVGTQTLKAWLGFWTSPDSQARADELGTPRSYHVRRISTELAARGYPPEGWSPEDAVDWRAEGLEVLTHEQATEALGFDPEANER